jgi:hypothetical protein
MTARTGLATIISTLRGMTNAGTADYSIAGTSWWSDDQLQEALDRNRVDIIRCEMASLENYDGAGTLVYKQYLMGWQNIESGSAVFEIQDSMGNVVGTANYTVDYARGMVTFTADQGGSVYYWTGRSYDLNGAAADVWRRKAAQTAGGAISWATDNMRVDKGKLVESALKMAEYYSKITRITAVDMLRGDEA